MKAITAYVEAKKAFQELTACIAAEKLQLWRKMETEALEKGGTLLENLYNLQIEANSSKSFYPIGLSQTPLTEEIQYHHWQRSLLSWTPS